MIINEDFFNFVIEKPLEFLDLINDDEEILKKIQKSTKKVSA
jgi:hypothetical protein